ncbi:hypothetical protein MSG28_003836 [Choristoneura fumiferana]|uniref:Uncharacterized protein n=1 Tax=Choristoneura fumiferana TaxID=7141 RepID=A0ACC0KH28_CHOFU|nr:hypothetical protein MSG28_003836 [Choristoneura fumiferana]
MVASKLFLFLGLVTLACCNTVRQTENDILEIEAYIDSKRPEINQRYRLHYHVAAPVGWINDPNGFTYYKSEYHLFYQYYPYDSVWGPMHWGHVASKDLVHWRYLPTALVPEKEQCFSGSAVVDGDTMILMYTGHVNLDAEPWANETQYIAYSDDGITFHKYEGNPVIAAAPNDSPDFRDPKAWRHGDHWYVVIGSKTTDQRGRILLYRSTDMKNWEFLNVLAESNGESYMYECPDFFELDGKHILLMSPQGMEPQGDRYKNLHQTGFIIGSFNYDTFEFVPEVDFQEIDYGHDFYAAQTMEAFGRRVLVGWFNMWEQPHPEKEDGWSGAMTIVRELRLVGDRITMWPVEDMIQLRDEVKMVGVLQPNQELRFGKTAELIVSGDLTQKMEIQIEGTSGGEKAWLRWEPDVGKVVVDRGSGDIRQVEWTPILSKRWRIFLDASSMELFCGEGEVVFSSRVYPEAPVGWINDPNGFSYFRLEYHVFYQYYPYDSVWGPMHWGHVASHDLVHWRHYPIALVPEEEQCFSGSAVVDEDKMILMYTGHVNLDAEPWANETQYMAYSTNGVEFHKYEGNPVIAAAPNGSPDFRDPKVWKHGDYWYAVIGKIDYGHNFYAAQTTEAFGRRFLIGWFSMFDQPYPEQEDGWSGALTIIRELSLVSNRIIMKPMEDMVELRDEVKMVGVLRPERKLQFGKTAELVVLGDLSQKMELLIEGSNGGDKICIRWEPDVGKMVVEKGTGDIRQAEWLPIDSKSWRIFLDASSMELFCGEGEVNLVVFSDWALKKYWKVSVQFIVLGMAAVACVMKASYDARGHDAEF